MKKTKKLITTILMTVLCFSTFVPGASVSAFAEEAQSAVTAYGWYESLTALIPGIKAEEVTGVKYMGAGASKSVELGAEDLKYLVRDTSDGVRIDIPGVAAGKYSLYVNAKGNTYAKGGIEVKAYDRSGFAHDTTNPDATSAQIYAYNGQGVGAYKEDGTLKDNAIVLYVTDENKNSVSLTCGDTTVTGIGNILNSKNGIINKLASENIPLAVRFVGVISESGLYSQGQFDAKADGLIDGLSEYGGAENGHMASMKSGKDITLEGVGHDATIDGWGFNFSCESGKPSLGKSFEVRNLTFINTPEDAIGMEGMQSGTDLTGSVERCWIHRNSFYRPDIKNPAEADKAQGDGSVDFKRGQFYTNCYNYYEGCHKTHLIGGGNNNLQFNVTFHHNYYKDCNSRGPLSRHANIHIYNNIYEGQTFYAQNARADAFIFSEYNYFLSCNDPFLIDSSAPGVIKSFNNTLTEDCVQSDQPVVHVTSRDTHVDNNCKFESRNMDYSSFETDPTISYVGKGTGYYSLETDMDALYAKKDDFTGVMKDKPLWNNESSDPDPDPDPDPNPDSDPNPDPDLDPDKDKDVTVTTVSVGQVTIGNVTYPITRKNESIHYNPKGAVINELLLGGAKVGEPVGENKSFIFKKIKYKNNKKVGTGQAVIMLKAAKGADAAVKADVKAANAAFKSNPISFEIVRCPLNVRVPQGKLLYSEKKGKFKSALTVVYEGSKPYKLKLKPGSPKTDIAIEGAFEKSVEGQYPAQVTITGMNNFEGSVSVPVEVK